MIAIAVLDLSKHLLEEEVLRPREPPSASGMRKTLTKFPVIIAIAVMLEALVLSFGASRHPVKMPLYSALSLIAAVILMIGLGRYQRLRKTLNPNAIEEMRKSTSRDRPERVLGVSSIRTQTGLAL